MTAVTAECEPFTSRLYMAGDIDTAKQAVREFCFTEGWCVTVSPTTYVYTGGEEEGFIVEAINYGRFPSTHAETDAKLRRLAETLRERCCQHSYSLVGVRSEWVSHRAT